MKKRGEGEEDNLLKDILGDDSEEEAFPLVAEQLQHQDVHHPSKRRAIDEPSWEDQQRRGRWEEPSSRRLSPPPVRSDRGYHHPDQGYHRGGYYSPPRYQQDPGWHQSRGQYPREHYPQNPYPYEVDEYRRDYRRSNDYRYDEQHYHVSSGGGNHEGYPRRSHYHDYTTGTRSYGGEPRFQEPKDRHDDHHEDGRGAELIRPKSASDVPQPSSPSAPTKAKTEPSNRSEDGELAAPKTGKITPIVFDLDQQQQQQQKEIKRATSATMIAKPVPSSDAAVRYFVARCNYYDMFVKSKWEGVWKAPSYIVRPIEAALASCDQAWLFFSVHGSQYYQGIAQVDRSRPIEYPTGRMKLAKLPISWIIIADVPYGAFPNIPGILSDEGGLRETFEIPLHHGKELLPIFQKHKAMDSTLA